MLFDQAPITILFVRFVCITILHLSLIDTTFNYLNMMKFVTNHPYKFQSPEQTFFSSVTQFFVAVLIEMTNSMVLLCTPSSLELVSNFVALVIVAEFDKFVYASMKDEPLKQLT